MEENIADNSNITQYQNTSNPICMNAKDWRRQLERDKKTLLKQYPNLGNPQLDAVDFFNELINGEFTDGITKRVFIRNHILEDNDDHLNLAIRPERTPMDYLSRAMPDDKTLLFRGQVRGAFFVVDNVSDQYAEELLPYEVECQIIRYDDVARMKNASRNGNFLYDVAEKSSSLNEHTKERLTEWRNYIKWRRTIVKERVQRHGSKYIRVESRNGNLIFTLQFASKEAYESECKWLNKSELAAYDGKTFSDDDGNFVYKDNITAKNDLQPLGKFMRRAKQEGRELKDGFEIELTYAAPDSDDLNEMTDEERENYVQNELLPRFPESGFLAPFVVKDVSLFSRLDNAINNFQKDFYCISPNMAMWIFDVKRARLPKPQDREKWLNAVGDDWLNKSVAENENQREAIFKMLEAPDLCLIQGPPGTGKTTVIAEAIYQFVKQGNSVLLASQSHDAVDNALDRLAQRSEIRTIRLGERARIYDEEVSPFSKKRILSTYYKCLSNAIDTSFLKPWEENRRQYDTCELELRDWQNVSIDLTALNEQLIENNKERQQLKSTVSRLKKEIEQALAEKYDHEAADLQYQKFVDAVKHDEDFDDLFLPEFMGNIFAECFMPLLRSASAQGILLFPSLNEDVIRRDPNFFLRHSATTCRQIKILANKIAKAQKDANTDSELAQLKIIDFQKKIDEVNKILLEEDDSERRAELKEKRSRLEEEKEKLQESGALTFSAEELSLFDTQRQEQIKSSDNREVIIQNMREVVDGYNVALNDALNRIGDTLAAYKPKDIDALNEEVKSCQGRVNYLTDEEKRLKAEINAKEQLGKTLSEKYSCERDDLEMRIADEMRRLDLNWRKDSEIRDVWANTLDKFVSMLNNAKTAEYDEGYYLDTYLKSCNVVGITCTANMHELNELFPDFDVVIIDEVSKATPPELLPPLVKARKTILVGDHRQLPPVFDEYKKSYEELLEEIKAISQERDEDEDDEEDYNEDNELKSEDLERYRNMVTSSLFKEYFEAADDRIKHSLLTQYRMHLDIQNVINRFYDGKLKSGLLENENTLKAHGLKILTDRGESFLRPDIHAYWIDSSTLHGQIMEQSQYPNSTSLYNVFERYIILSILQKINRAYSDMGQSGVTVGVISFYGSQVGDLQNAVKILRRSGKLNALRVDVNTVDRFQGKEKQIIITSLVCNTKRGNASKHVAAFERINVAFSRAQNLLIIVGAKSLYGRLNIPIPNMDTGEIRSAHIYQNIIDDIERNGGRIAGELLINADDAKKIREEYDKGATKQ